MASANETYLQKNSNNSTDRHSFSQVEFEDGSTKPVQMKLAAVTSPPVYTLRFPNDDDVVIAFTSYTLKKLSWRGFDGKYYPAKPFIIPYSSRTREAKKVLPPLASLSIIPDSWLILADQAYPGMFVKASPVEVLAFERLSELRSLYHWTRERQFFTAVTNVQLLRELTDIRKSAENLSRLGYFDEQIDFAIQHFAQTSPRSARHVWELLDVLRDFEQSSR